MGSQSSKETLPRIAAKVAGKEPAKASKAEEKTPPSEAPKVHWSELELLLTDASRASEKPAVTRLGDGALDEDAERAAFQAAVMEWRMAGNPSGQHLVDELQRGDGGKEVAERVMYAGRRSSAMADEEVDSAWHDPFHSRDEAEIDEAKEHEVAIISISHKS